ncbi:erythromycin esterase family protein [Hymenobacter tenuis]
MFLGFRLVCILSLSLLTITASRAQSAFSLPSGLVTHPVRSINPTDTDFQDLAFLRQEIGSARIVMLGEPTHGVGNATEARLRVLRFLKERMGFTTVAFESGFYALDRAEREIQAGAPVAAAISASVYPVWTETQEFQAILPLLGKGEMRVAGFDSQVGWGNDELLEELEAFLKPEKGVDGIAYDYLDECLSTMGETNIFPPSHQILLFTAQLNKARKLLEKVAAGPDAARRERAKFWLQNLRSIRALAQDYTTNDPAAKDSASFKASDSNARDAQMADNLLWYVRQHPQEKVVCLGAIGHLANKVATLENAELREFKPMGQTVKEALGQDAVYVLSTVAGGGTHGFGYWGKHQPVPAPAAGSLEAELLAQGQEYSFVSLKHDAPSRRLTTYAFEFMPIAGPWSEVLDGVLYLKSVNPPHAAAAIAGAEVPVEPTTATMPPAGPLRPNPALCLPAKTGATLTLGGTILDRKTGQPVPFATIAIPSRSAGTITDAQGRFRLEARRGETVQVSSIGYEPTTWAAQRGGALAVKLQPAAFALGNVRVSAQSQDPKRIMKKVIKAAETNYERQDYVAQAYIHRRSISFDTLSQELECVGQEYVPAGYKNWAGGFLGMEPYPLIRLQQKHVLAPVPEPEGIVGNDEGGHGFAGGFDPVRISPLFKSSTLGKYQLHLDTIEQRGTETVYVIRFAAKRANHRTTGMYLEGGYSGKVYIREQDYAVVRYEALWQEDTLKWNSIARKYHGTRSPISRLYQGVYSEHRKAHVVVYQKAPSGRYYAASSVAQASAVGRVLGAGAFHKQKTNEVYFSAPVPVAATDMPDQKVSKDMRGGGLWQLSKVPYRPEFWQTYQRPVPTEPAPELKAVAP